MHSAFVEADRSQRAARCEQARDPAWTGLRITRPEVTRLVWRGLLLGVVLWALPLAVGVGTSLLLMVVIGLAAVAAARAVSATGPLPAEEPGPLAPAMAPVPDRPFAAVSAWQDRLSWGQQDRGRFESGVRPGLVRLAEERLLQRHGITRAAHPERARQLMGERLWNLATQPAPAANRQRSVPMTLTDLVADLERI